MNCEIVAPSRRIARHQERRAAIIALAQRMFGQYGYGATTMSALALGLGGSKTTLWTYFASKEELFAAVIDQLIIDVSPSMALDEDSPIDKTLESYAIEFLTVMLSPQTVALYRIVIGEASRFPEIGRIFYERGPLHRNYIIAKYLDKQIKKGVIHDLDTIKLSMQFHHLCFAGLFSRTLWGVAEMQNAELIQDDANRAVRLLLEGCS